MNEETNSKKKLIELLSQPKNKQAIQHKDIEMQTQNLRSPKHRKNHEDAFSDIFAKTDPQKKTQYNQDDLREQIFEKMFISKQDKYAPAQLQVHKRLITNLWEYRYWKYIDYAIQTKDWLKVFSFLGQFKQKCLDMAKMMLEQNFNVKQIDINDHRYEYKYEGEIGMYLLDGIIIRVATQIQTKNQKKQNGVKNMQSFINKSAVKNLHQQFLGGNILNNLIISLRSQQPNLPTLRVPLQCLIKYMGYTFLFQADTLCQGIQTLVNGPMNITYKYCQQVQPILKLIGNNLNLKCFNVPKNNKNIQIPFSLTLQTHKVRNALADINFYNWINKQSILYPHDQQNNILNKPVYYLLNFSKLWPLFIDSNIINSSGYLRPEVVLSWKKQLSNVVFSDLCFQKDQIGELQLAEACKYVKEDTIKNLTKFLDQATYFVIDSTSIEQLMHQNGLNIKLMGDMASKFELESNRKVFEVQMVARTLKKLFFISARQFQQQFDVKDLYLDFLNLVFIKSQQGQKFWMNSVYKHVQKYYQYQINEYPPNFQGGGLLHALNYHIGIKIKMNDYPFFKQVDGIFTTSHIVNVYGNAKTYDLETTQLMRYCKNYKAKKKIGIYSEAIEALKLLIQIKIAEYPKGTCELSSRPESFFYGQLAQIYKNLQQYDKALEYSQLALQGIPEKHSDAVKAYCVLIKCHNQRKQLNKCMEYSQKSIANLNYHLALNHPLTISVYNILGFQFLSTSNDPSKCEKIFAKSFEISERSLGYMHKNSGKILLQLADLPLPPQKTINFLLQALTILQNIQSDKQKVRLVCMKIAQLYHKIGNLSKQIHFAKRSDHWRMQILALQKLNEHKSVMQLCNKIPMDSNQLVFLIEKSFSSYIRLISNQPTRNLYKLYISVQQNLQNRQKVIQRVLKKFIYSINMTQTANQYVKNCLTNLIGFLPQILKREDFYIGYEFFQQLDNAKIMNYLKTYMAIISIVGPTKVQQIFNEFEKIF